MNDDEPDASGRVLIAEDYQPNALFMVAALEMAGYTVDLAANGRIAANMAEAVRYDAILMDIEMPEMDGIAATQAIRDIEEAEGVAPVPILGITGHTMASVRLLCLKSGMSDFIVKPFLPGVLYDKLAALIAGTPCVDAGRIAARPV